MIDENFVIISRIDSKLKTYHYNGYQEKLCNPSIIKVKDSKPITCIYKNKVRQIKCSESFNRLIWKINKLSKL